MLRLLDGALLVLVPFAAYGAWRAAAAGGGPSRRMLAAAGLALALLLALLGWQVFSERLPDGGVYVPPRIEDGRIVPAETMPR